MSGPVHLLSEFVTPMPLSCRRCNRDLPDETYITETASGNEVSCTCPNCGAPLTFWLVKA